MSLNVAGPACSRKRTLIDSSKMSLRLTGDLEIFNAGDDHPILGYATCP